MITGGGGRLGSIVSKAILDNGYSVRIFDIENNRKRKTVKGLSGNLEIFWGDVTKPELVQKSIEGIDLVLHMAALIPPIAYKNPEVTFNVNVGGTKNMVEAIKKSGRYFHLFILPRQRRLALLLMLKNCFAQMRPSAIRGLMARPSSVQKT